MKINKFQSIRVKQALQLFIVAAIAAFTMFCATGCHKDDGGGAHGGGIAITDTEHWTVHDTDRTAIVYIPPNANSQPTPVIFDFHGFGITMQQNYNQHRFDQAWPNAIVVWPQGLPVPGEALGLPPGPGWQLGPNQFNGRDLAFFDAMLKTLQSKYHVDASRIYATGHSNGGGFTMLLWAVRGSELAAVGPSAAPTVDTVEKLIQPKPVIQITGTADSVVSPASQFAMFNYDKKLNSWTGDSTVYAPDAMLYPSSTGNPSVLYKHSKGHVYPAEALPVVVKFFQSQQRH